MNNKIKKYTIKQFVHEAKPFKSQRTKAGEADVNESRVKELMKIGAKCLQHGIFVADVRGLSGTQVLCGNHRQEAMRRLLEEGKVSGEETFEATLYTDLKREEAEKYCYLDNFSKATGNKHKQVIGAHVDFSRQVFQPLLEAFKKAGFFSKDFNAISRSNTYEIIIKLGAVMDSYGVTTLDGIDGPTLYSGRKLPAAKGQGGHLDAHPSIDLRGLEDELAVELHPLKQMLVAWTEAPGCHVLYTSTNTRSTMVHFYLVWTLMFLGAESDRVKFLKSLRKLFSHPRTRDIWVGVKDGFYNDPSAHTDTFFRHAIGKFIR